MQAPIGPDSVWNKPGGKKLYSYPGAGGGVSGGNNHHHQFASTHQGPVSGFPPQGMMGVSNGGPGQYDIERRPPKSAELFDPDGPQSTGSAGQHHSNTRHHSFHDNDGGMGERQFQGSHHSGPNQTQYSRQMNQQQTHQPPSSTGHASVGMSRTYSSSSSGTGHTSSPAPQGKKNSLLYDYSTPTVPYDGTPKCTPGMSSQHVFSTALVRRMLCVCFNATLSP